MMVAVPLLGLSRQHSILMVVVLPAPFGPNSENSSPWYTERSKASTAQSFRNDLETAVICMAMGCSAAASLTLASLDLVGTANPSIAHAAMSSLARRHCWDTGPSVPAKIHCVLAFVSNWTERVELLLVAWTNC